ncbi:MAG: helical backbone metal receptor, partial [Bdellovibrionota bacterium]
RNQVAVISLVPSWTETLIEAGVDVIGRTRFCVHPQRRVKAIPVVGGTKDWNWDRIVELNPDLLVLDQEENPKCMSEQKEFPFLATHVRSVGDVASSLRLLGRSTGNARLSEIASDWDRVLARPLPEPWVLGREIPGLVEWGRKPSVPVTKVVYVIWREPWMAVSRETFIGSMLERCGFGELVSSYPEKYPKVSLESEGESTLVLFSSEPFPFLKKRDGIAELGFPYAFVDGEKFSWFGVRSLEFLRDR